jgi:hypothetical protein
VPILNFNDYFPTQFGNNNKFLTTNGSVLSWSSLSTETLSNGSFIPLSNVVNSFTAQQYFLEVTLTDGATINWAVSGAQVAKVTLAGNRTVAAPTGLQNGAFYSLMVIQDGTGSRTLSWNSVFKWNSGVAPTLSTAASARDIFTFRSDGTNLYEVGRNLGLA